MFQNFEWNIKCIHSIYFNFFELVYTFNLYFTKLYKYQNLPVKSSINGRHIPFWEYFLFDGCYQLMDLILFTIF